MINIKSGTFKVTDLNAFKTFCENWQLSGEVVDPKEKLVKFSGESEAYLANRIEGVTEDLMVDLWFDDEVSELLEKEHDSVLYLQEEKGLVTLTKNTWYRDSYGSESILLSEENVEDLKILL